VPKHGPKQEERPQFATSPAQGATRMAGELLADSRRLAAEWEVSWLVGTAAVHKTGELPSGTYDIPSCLSFASALVVA
jgi:hypothetical protein